MSNLPPHLFRDADLGGTLRNNLERAKRDVDEIPEERFKQATDEELVEHVYSMREVVPLELHEDRMVMDTEEVKVDVRHDFSRAVFDQSRPCLIAGVRVTVSIPFSGEPFLWKCRPSTSNFNPPRAFVHENRGGLGGKLTIVMEGPTDSVGDGKGFKRELDETLNNIRGYLGYMQQDLRGCETNLRVHTQQCVAGRRQRLGKHADLVTALNIPLRRNPDAPPVEPLPIKRKLVKPLPTRQALPPEPGVSKEEYDFILNVIRHAGRTFEAAPRTFAKHDEEELRDILLAHLNGHYQGDATGETFRKSGKTDIRIEDSSRAAFVAECKVWRGEGEVGKALDQLLGYLTWRDSKAALVFFNKSVSGFVALQEKLRQAVNGHALRETALTCNQSGEWRFRFRSAEDADHKVEIHVFFFNLFVAKNGGR